MTGRRLAATVLAVAGAVVTTACGKGAGQAQVTAHVTDAAPPSAADQRAADIYVAALRAHLAIDPGVASPTWIDTHLSRSTVTVPRTVQASG